MYVFALLSRGHRSLDISTLTNEGPQLGRNAFWDRPGYFLGQGRICTFDLLGRVIGNATLISGQEMLVLIILFIYFQRIYINFIYSFLILHEHIHGNIDIF